MQFGMRFIILSEPRYISSSKNIQKEKSTLIKTQKAGIMVKFCKSDMVECHYFFQHFLVNLTLLRTNFNNLQQQVHHHYRTQPLTQISSLKVAKICCFDQLFYTKYGGVLSVFWNLIILNLKELEIFCSIFPAIWCICLRRTQQYNSVG